MFHYDLGNYGSIAEWNIRKGSSFEEIKSGIIDANTQCGYLFGTILRIIDRKDHVVIESQHGSNGYKTHTATRTIRK